MVVFLIYLKNFLAVVLVDSSRQRGPSRGSDLRYNMAISLKEAFAGKKTEIRIPGYTGCDNV